MAGHGIPLIVADEGTGTCDEIEEATRVDHAGVAHAHDPGEPGEVGVDEAQCAADRHVCEAAGNEDGPHRVNLFIEAVNELGAEATTHQQLVAARREDTADPAGANCGALVALGVDDEGACRRDDDVVDVAAPAGDPSIVQGQDPPLREDRQGPGDDFFTDRARCPGGRRLRLAGERGSEPDEATPLRQTCRPLGRPAVELAPRLPSGCAR